MIIGVGITLAGIKSLADFNWFIGCALGFALYLLLMKNTKHAAA